MNERQSISANCLFILIACFASLDLPPAYAASKPVGELVDARPLSTDDSLVCSFYLNKSKVETVLSKTDGKKHLKKPFWTMSLLKKSLTSLTLSIKKFGTPSSPTSIKKLKKLKNDKKALSLTKKQITECNSSGDPRETSSTVQFKHVSGIIQTQCMQCHGVLGWKNEENFFVNSGRVTPGDLEASPFYTFLSNNPEGFVPAYMPKGLAPLSDMNLMLLARWIGNLKSSSGPAPTPTPGGTLGEGRSLYNTFCASCHGSIDVSAKWGKSAAQIKAALGTGGIPQMRHLNLTDDQIQKIALALSSVQPPQEGSLTIRSLGSTPEGNNENSNSLQFEVTLNGTASQPFSVGYVTSNGTALADSDYKFSVGTLQFQGSNGEKKIINIEIIGDNNQESDESVYVDIGGVSHGGVRVETSTAFGTISNDDTFSQVLPVQPGKLRLAYGFNGNYLDALGLSDGQPQGDTLISSAAKIGSGALELDSGSDHVLVPGARLQGNTDFSLASWVYWDNSASTSSRVFDFGSSTSNYIFFAPKDSANRCRFELRTASGTFTLQCNTGVALPANRWVHVVTVFNSVTDEMKIYFDGQQVATRTGVTLALSTLTTTNNRIGSSRVSGSTDFSGRIDELSVWDAALTPAEIAQVMAMTQSISINSAMEVRLNNQLIGNGSNLDLGSVQVGQTLNLALTISNNGLAGLAMFGDPVVQVAGRNASEFAVKHQPWPWQELLGGGSFASFSLRYAPSAPGDKLATLIIPNSDLLNGNFAAALSAQASGDPLPEPPPPGSGESPLVNGQYLYALNCSSCHGNLAQSQKKGASLQAVTAALNPTSGVPQMRGLGLSSAQIADIVLALNSAPPSSGTADKVGSSIINIGTAPFVASVLTRVFLPDDASTFTTDDTNINTKISEGILGRRANGTFIAGRIAAFGGRCERHENDSGSTVCQSEALLSPQRPSPSTVRSGLIIRTCDEVLNIDRAVQTALAKVQRTTSSTIDAQAVKDLYQLFFPGRDLPAYLSEVISNFTRGAAALSQTDHWRYQLHLICSSNDWEVL